MRPPGVLVTSAPEGSVGSSGNHSEVVASKDSENKEKEDKGENKNGDLSQDEEYEGDQEEYAEEFAAIRQAKKPLSELSEECQRELLLTESSIVSGGGEGEDNGEGVKELSEEEEISVQEVQAQRKEDRKERKKGKSKKKKRKHSKRKEKQKKTKHGKKQKKEKEVSASSSSSSSDSDSSVSAGDEVEGTGLRSAAKAKPATVVPASDSKATASPPALPPSDLSPPGCKFGNCVFVGTLDATARPLCRTIAQSVELVLEEGSAEEMQMFTPTPNGFVLFVSALPLPSLCPLCSPSALPLPSLCPLCSPSALPLPWRLLSSCW
jgi:hypothetical protein